LGRTLLIPSSQKGRFFVTAETFARRFFSDMNGGWIVHEATITTI
jgi:hypothetical protein